MLRQSLKLQKIILLILIPVLLPAQVLLNEQLSDHQVLLDNYNRLLPWTSYDNVIRWSMNFIKNCPKVTTKLGDDPFYLVTSEINPDGSFHAWQNNQGSNVYWGIQTALKYYAYSGDTAIIAPIRHLLDRVLKFHTPTDWAWHNVPRTQDDTPDGEYTDEWSEPDKMCMVGTGYLKFFKFSGEKKYLNAALDIAAVIDQHIEPGDEEHSPLPFRVNLQTGAVLDSYCSNMIAPIVFFDELISLGYHGKNNCYVKHRELIWSWILNFPMKNNKWSGYYEDVPSNQSNMNQQNPMEAARYLLEHPEIDPDSQQHVSNLIGWVKQRFGQTRRYSATSIKEQDSWFKEISSHTARSASIMAKWFGVTGDSNDYEEARASFALATYTTCNKFSKPDEAINYTGLEHESPWFSDSYFDFLSHFFDGMAELPEMAPQDQDHIISSSSIISNVNYSPQRIEYHTFEPDGSEILKISFDPQVFGDGKPLSPSQWSYGDYRNVPGVLRISRIGIKTVTITAK
jgi:hypothetical protein